jgi:hypothetical protein
MQEIIIELKQLKEYYKTSAYSERKIIRERIKYLEQRLKYWDDYLAL